MFFQPNIDRVRAHRPRDFFHLGSGPDLGRLQRAARRIRLSVLQTTRKESHEFSFWSVLEHFSRPLLFPDVYVGIASYSNTGAAICGAIFKAFLALPPLVPGCCRLIDSIRAFTARISHPSGARCTVVETNQIKALWLPRGSPPCQPIRQLSAEGNLLCSKRQSHGQGSLPRDVFRSTFAHPTSRIIIYRSQ